jgi:serine/threonine-protein kinase HipA
MLTVYTRRGAVSRGASVRRPSSCHGQVEFLYDEGYAAFSGSTPLSLSMPTSVLGHGPDIVMPWLSNLLPDAEEVRSRWAAKFGERRTDPFSLLAHMGEDAPGSVQVVAEGVTPAEAGEMSPLTDRDIARRVRAILDDPDHWVDDTDDDHSRFSLGGNQGKFALARHDGQWWEPTMADMVEVVENSSSPSYRAGEWRNGRWATGRYRGRAR